MGNIFAQHLAKLKKKYDEYKNNTNKKTIFLHCIALYVVTQQQQQQQPTVEVQQWQLTQVVDFHKAERGDFN